MPPRRFGKSGADGKTFLYMAITRIIKRMEAQKLLLLVESEEQTVYASDREGLHPLRDAAFTHPELLDGSDVAMPVIGLAAAYLLIYGKVGRVYAETMTTAARAAFREEGIEHEALTFTKKLNQKDGAATAEYEALSLEAITPLAFIEALNRRAT